MYRINDEKAYIKLLQKLLFIRQTGALDKATKRAIIHFKLSNMLQPTPLVCYDTFIALVTRYKQLQTINDCESSLGFRLRLQQRYGNKGKDIEYTNNMLAQCISKNGSSAQLPSGARFDYATINAVRVMRKQLRLKADDGIDVEMLSLLIKLCDSYSLKK